MKVISLMQPWADLVVRQFKIFETRSWRTSHTGRLYIHASKRFPREYQRLLEEQPFRSALNTPADELTTGAIVGGVDLKQCMRTEGMVVSSVERSFGDFGPDRFAWELENAFQFQAIPCKGMLGLWKPSDEVNELIMQRIKL